MTILTRFALTFFMTFCAGFALAEECAITVDSTDAMRFDTDSITVSKSCETFTVTLTHSGKLSEKVMGHNWVLTKTADMEAVVKDGMGAGLENEYIKPDDKRVIAHTEIIGGGEKTSVTFEVAKLNANGDYSFFCSFPGHYALMKGKLVVK